MSQFHVFFHSDGGIRLLIARFRTNDDHYYREISKKEYTISLNVATLKLMRLAELARRDVHNAKTLAYPDGYTITFFGEIMI
jgi:hypothetical protein